MKRELHEKLKETITDTVLSMVSGDDNFFDFELITNEVERVIEEYMGDYE